MQASWATTTDFQRSSDQLLADSVAVLMRFAAKGTPRGILDASAMLFVLHFSPARRA